MVQCIACEQELKSDDVTGCSDDRTITVDGSEYEPIEYGQVAGQTGPCHDCGALPGEYHHPGCDMEVCPFCGGQYFICDCMTDEKREIWQQ